MTGGSGSGGRGRMSAWADPEVGPEYYWAGAGSSAGATISPSAGATAPVSAPTHISGTCSGATVLVIRMQAQSWDSCQLPSTLTNSTPSASWSGRSGRVNMTVVSTSDWGSYPGRTEPTTWNSAPDSTLAWVMVSNSSGAFSEP